MVEGLQPANFIQAQEMDNSMDAAGFDREYNSIWAGSIEGAFFNPNKFDQHRVLNIAETKFNKGIPTKGFYMMGVDVGRLGDMTECIVLKCTPYPDGTYRKQVVNIFTLEAEHFERQAIFIKRIFRDFKCNICVLDGNGNGIGLVDFLVIDQIDPDTDEILPNWGVYNDEKKKYRNFQTEITIHNALYIMKASAPINSELYSYCQSNLNNGRLLFLIDESVAKNKLMAMAQGKKMSQPQRAEYLRPYVETSILKSQMMNMIQDNEGANIILRQSSRKIGKDKFSALIYALSWCKMLEEKRGKRGSRNMSDFMFFSPRK